MARKAHRKIFGCAMPTSGTNPTPKPIELVEVKSHVSTYDKRTGNLQETNGDWSHSQHNRYKISCMVINLYYSWSINESFILLGWSCTILLTNSAMFSSDTRLLQRSLFIFIKASELSLDSVIVDRLAVYLLQLYYEFFIFYLLWSGYSHRQTVSLEVTDWKSQQSVCWVTQTHLHRTTPYLLNLWYKA